MTTNPYSVPQIVAAVDAARRMRPDLSPDLAESYLQAGRSVNSVKAELFELMTEPLGATGDQKAASESAKASMRAELKRMGLTPVENGGR